MPTLDEQVNVRISSDDVPLLEKVMLYRFQQGKLKKTTLPEYIRYLLNRDITDVAQEIQKRRG